MTPTVSELVKHTSGAHFQYYRDGELWYRIPYPGGISSVNKFFDFPVPIADTGPGVFEKIMKPISMMRWINKHLSTLAKWEKEKDDIKATDFSA